MALLHPSNKRACYIQMEVVSVSSIEFQGIIRQIIYYLFKSYSYGFGDEEFKAHLWNGSTAGKNPIKANDIPMKFSNCSNNILVGDEHNFALKSCVTEFYKNRGQMALGCFIICLGGKQYGVDAPDATLLACSFDAVRERIEAQGSHNCTFADEADGIRIAQAFYDAEYREPDASQEVFGLPLTEIQSAIARKAIMWAPDGDEAFDDGSFVLQFDVADQVRLIAFRVNDQGYVQQSSYTDFWLDFSDYYSVLNDWASSFVTQWENAVNR